MCHGMYSRPLASCGDIMCDRLNPARSNGGLTERFSRLPGLAFVFPAVLYDVPPLRHRTRYDNLGVQFCSVHMIRPRKTDEEPPQCALARKNFERQSPKHASTAGLLEFEMYACVFSNMGLTTHPMLPRFPSTIDRSGFLVGEQGRSSSPSSECLVVHTRGGQ